MPPGIVLGGTGNALFQRKEVKMELITTKDMQKNSTKEIFTPGEIYTAKDATYGTVKAMFVKATEAIAVAGSPMSPVTASFTVAGKFLCSDDENGTGVIGQEWCVGSWLGGVTTAAAYGFVQTYGWNLVTLTTDDSVAALDVVMPSTTDGTWLGVARSVLGVDATASVVQPCGFAPAADGGTTMTAGKVWFNIPGLG